jgi:drug/metabolite transporter (DMT)-like permease
MTNTALGIGLGLAAAVCQSATYLQSRHFVGGENGGRLRLLFLSCLIQGVVSLVLLPFVWSPQMPPLRQYIIPLVISSSTYMIGQAFLFTALRHTEASRVSPFLGMKIVILALLSWLVLGKEITTLQWIAVVIATIAAWSLNSSGGGIPLRATLAILMTCLGYSVSDLFIRITIDHLTPLPPLRASVVALVLTYIVCGLTALPLWWKIGKISWTDLRRATPFALTWLTSMAFLYACFATVGVVLGNIVQSSRGLISILSAPMVARGDWSHLETKAPAHAVLRRAAVGVLMMLAVALYVIKKWH